MISKKFKARMEEIKESLKDVQELETAISKERFDRAVEQLTCLPVSTDTEDSSTTGNTK